MSSGPDVIRARALAAGHFLPGGAVIASVRLVQGGKRVRIKTLSGRTTSIPADRLVTVIGRAEQGR